MPTDKKATSGGGVTAIAAKAPAKATLPALTGAQSATLMDKAQHGDAKAWSALKADLDRIPGWETAYDSPAVYTRRMLLDAMVGNNYLIKEAWERQVRAMLTELAGPNPTPLERTLCERVATCWLDMSLAELSYAGRLKDGMSFAAGEYYQKAKDRAHKRYLTACLALAKVRRLLAPVAQQINIAQPGAAQLNVAAPAQPVTPASVAGMSATVDADNLTGHGVKRGRSEQA